MKQNLITDVIQGMLPYLNNAQTERLQEVLQHTLFDYEVREAAREGTPITLIDGNDLIRLVIKYELYITPVTTYVLDGFYTED